MIAIGSGTDRVMPVVPAPQTGGRELGGRRRGVAARLPRPAGCSPRQTGDWKMDSTHHQPAPQSEWPDRSASGRRVTGSELVKRRCAVHGSVTWGHDVALTSPEVKRHGWRHGLRAWRKALVGLLK